MIELLITPNPNDRTNPSIGSVLVNAQDGVWRVFIDPDGDYVSSFDHLQDALIWVAKYIQDPSSVAENL